MENNQIRPSQVLDVTIPTQYGNLSVTDAIARKAYEFFSGKAAEGEATFRMAAVKMARLADISPATFYKILGIFEGHRLLQYSKGEGQRANTYTWLGGVAPVNTLLVDSDKKELWATIHELNHKVEQANEMIRSLNTQIDQYRKLCDQHGIPTRTIEQMATFKAQVQ